VKLPWVALSILAVVLVVPGVWGVSSSSPGTTSADFAPHLAMPSPESPLPPGANVGTYLGSVNRTSNSTGEVLINASNVGQLHTLWRFASGSAAAPEPIVVNGVVYEGSWNGNEYALWALNGSKIWKTFLGRGGNHGSIGVTSTATWMDGTLYVGGGNSTLYALNASTGAIEWSTRVGVKGENYYIWTSPLVTEQYVYLGVDSFFDSPLVPSGFNQYYRSNGTLWHSFNSSRPFVNGSGIWSSPSMSGNSIFITTGNPPNLKQGNYSESIIELNATTLAVEHKWQVPKTQEISDGDFGATPMLYSVRTAHGVLRMVTAADKNGRLYAWYQSNLTLAWNLSVSNLSETVQDTIITTSWNGQYLFDYAPETYVANGTEYNGTLRALEPTNGAVAWQVGLPQPWSADMYGAPLCFNGMVVIPDNSTIYVFNATNGRQLYEYDAGTTAMGALTVSRGELFMGLKGGRIVALDLRITPKMTAQPHSGPAPLKVNFEASAHGGLPPYSFAWTFGDGTDGAGPSPVHDFAAQGTYTVTVTVTDEAGSHESTHMTITVTAGSSTHTDGAGPWEPWQLRRAS
jgi:outer membrane protein assembly factor BamB